MRAHFGVQFRLNSKTNTNWLVIARRVAVKLRRADLSVVTADELGPGDTFGEACMLDERRTLRRNSRFCNPPGNDGGLGPDSHSRVGGGGQREQFGGVHGENDSGTSMETYQTLEVCSLCHRPGDWRCLTGSKQGLQKGSVEFVLSLRTGMLGPVTSSLRELAPIERFVRPRGIQLLLDRGA